RRGRPRGRVRRGGARPTPEPPPGRWAAWRSCPSQQHGVVGVVDEVAVESPARAFYQGADLLDGDVSLPPPRRGGPLVADAEADLGRALRLDRRADENGL